MSARKRKRFILRSIACVLFGSRSRRFVTVYYTHIRSEEISAARPSTHRKHFNCECRYARFEFKRVHHVNTHIHSYIHTHTRTYIGKHNNNNTYARVRYIHNILCSRTICISYNIILCNTIVVYYFSG